MVNKSVEIKNPYTPEDNKQNHRKNSFGSGSIFHDANTPVKTIIDVRTSITTDIPSTPTE